MTTCPHPSAALIRRPLVATDRQTPRSPQTIWRRLAQRRPEPQRRPRHRQDRPPALPSGMKPTARWLPAASLSSLFRFRPPGAAPCLSVFLAATPPWPKRRPRGGRARATAPGSRRPLSCRRLRTKTNVPPELPPSATKQPPPPSCSRLQQKKEMCSVTTNQSASSLAVPGLGSWGLRAAAPCTGAASPAVPGPPPCAGGSSCCHLATFLGSSCSSAHTVTSARPPVRQNMLLRIQTNNCHVCLSVCLSLRPSVCLSVCLSACLPVCLPLLGCSTLNSGSQSQDPVSTSIEISVRTWTQHPQQLQQQPQAPGRAAHMV
jgi:hypothetical protein